MKLERNKDGAWRCQAAEFFFFFTSNIFYCRSSTVVTIFPPPLSPAPPTPTSHLPLRILPCSGFAHGFFIHLPWGPFPFFPPLSPSPVWLLSVCSLFHCLWFYFACLFVLFISYCQFVLYFIVSGSILLACLFCSLGSTYRWDHMLFVFYLLAYFT